jgi:hypothetical protein
VRILLNVKDKVMNEEVDVMTQAVAAMTEQVESESAASQMWMNRRRIRDSIERSEGVRGAISELREILEGTPAAEWSEEHRTSSMDDERFVTILDEAFGLVGRALDSGRGLNDSQGLDISLSGVIFELADKYRSEDAGNRDEDDVKHWDNQTEDQREAIKGRLFVAFDRLFRMCLTEDQAKDSVNVERAFGFISVLLSHVRKKIESQGYLLHEKASIATFIHNCVSNWSPSYTGYIWYASAHRAITNSVGYRAPKAVTVATTNVRLTVFPGFIGVVEVLVQDAIED